MRILIEVETTDDKESVGVVNSKRACELIENEVGSLVDDLLYEADAESMVLGSCVLEVEE